MLLDEVRPVARGTCDLERDLRCDAESSRLATDTYYVWDIPALFPVAPKQTGHLPGSAAGSA